MVKYNLIKFLAKCYFLQIILNEQKTSADSFSYVLHSTNVTLEKAMSLCIQHGGTLAHFPQNYDFSTLIKTLQLPNFNQFWVHVGQDFNCTCLETDQDPSQYRPTIINCSSKIRFICRQPLSFTNSASYGHSLLKRSSPSPSLLTPSSTLLSYNSDITDQGSILPGAVSESFMFKRADVLEPSVQFSDDFSKLSQGLTAHSSVYMTHFDVICNDCGSDPATLSTSLTSDFRISLVTRAIHRSDMLMAVSAPKDSSHVSLPTPHHTVQHIIKLSETTQKRSFILESPINVPPFRTSRQSYLTTDTNQHMSTPTDSVIDGKISEISSVLNLHATETTKATTTLSDKILANPSCSQTMTSLAVSSNAIPISQLMTDLHTASFNHKDSSRGPSCNPIFCSDFYVYCAKLLENKSSQSFSQLLEKLRVDKKSTSKETRRLKSAHDGRTSSKAMGVGAMLVICSILASIAAMDLPRVIALFKNR